MLIPIIYSNLASRKQKNDIMVDFSKFNSLIQLTFYFNSNDKCIRFLEKERWNNEPVCPYCGSVHTYKRKNEHRYKCADYNSSFSVLVGTIFENTKISLVKWFMAMYLLSCHKKGISSHQLAKDIHVTQKTAWFILHKIRTLLSQETSIIEGEAECDETYIGGKETNKHECKRTPNTQGRSLKTKTAVFGIADRNGGIIAKKVLNTSSKTLGDLIRLHVKPNSRIFTDEYIGYNSLKESEYKHQFVYHKNKEHSDGNGVHTNTIEGFWSHLKRMIFGTYHFVSSVYLQRYVDESVFRYNTSTYKSGERFEMMLKKSIGKVSYSQVRMAS